MPPAFRSAVLTDVASTVDYLQDVIRYCSPDVAHHGWARMTMYRASDAMDTLGSLVGLIAAYLEHDGADPKLIGRLLRTDEECLRTATPPRSVGRPYCEPDMHVMPDGLREHMHNAVALVTLKLHVVIELSGRDGCRHWADGCLKELTDCMDTIGRSVRTIASTHVDELSTDTLAYYQHLFQQRPRSAMPSDDDRTYLAALLDLKGSDGTSAWGFIGRQRSSRDSESVEDPYESNVAAALSMLNGHLRDKPWATRDGVVLPPARDAALRFLHALRARSSADGDGALDWLGAAERALALEVARALDAYVRQPEASALQSPRARGARIGNAR